MSNVKGLKNGNVLRFVFKNGQSRELCIAHVCEVGSVTTLYIACPCGTHVNRLTLNEAGFRELASWEIIRDDPKAANLASPFADLIYPDHQLAELVRRSLNAGTIIPEDDQGEGGYFDQMIESLLGDIFPGAQVTVVSGRF